MTRASLACKNRLLVAALCAVSVTGSGVALAQPRPAGAASSATPAASAREYFAKALDLFKGKKYTQAMEQFRLSYAASPSPNSHLYIARCTAQLGETRAAWLEFDKVVDEAAARMISEDKYRATWDSAKLERDEIGQRLGLVTITVAHADPASAVHVGVYPVSPDRWGRPFPVEPGTYDARVETPNRPPVRSLLVIGAGEKRALTLDVATAPAPVAVAPPPPASSSGRMGPLRIAGIAVTAVGVVGFGMFAGGGFTSKSTYSTLTTECGTGGGCGGKNVSSEVSKGKTEQAVANAGLVLGAVGVAAGVTLIVLSTRRGRSDAGRPSADLVVGPSWAGVEGAW
jgi:hypothetical protein